MPDAIAAWCVKAILPVRAGRRRHVRAAGVVTRLVSAMHVSSYAQIEPFVTLDGSEIREWAGPLSAPAQNQSLAEATVPVGGATTEHYHRRSEEL
jgi:hypothetical protein